MATTEAQQSLASELGTDEHPGLPFKRRVLAIAAISFGNALLVIDGNIANIALPTLSRALDIRPADAINVIVVYNLVLVMGLLPMASLGNRIGHRRLYQTGQAVFCLASAGCFFAETLPHLLILRAAQAVGATMGLSVTIAMLRDIYPARNLGAGLGFNSLVLTSSLALAPTIGGFLLANYPWQWIFVFAAPLAVISFVFGRALPISERRATQTDWIGSLWIAATMALLVGGVQVATHFDPAGPGFGMFLVGTLSLAALVRRESQRQHPTVPVDLIARPAIGLAMLAAFAAFHLIGLLLISLPFRLEHAMGYRPDQVGLLLMPVPLTLALTNPLAGWLSDRVSPGKLGVAGLCASIVGLALLAAMPADTDYFGVAWRLMIAAGGFGFFISPNSRLIIGSVPRDRTASVGGMNQTLRLFAQASAAAAVGLMLSMGYGDGPAPDLIAIGMAGLAIACTAYRMSASEREPVGRV